MMRALIWAAVSTRAQADEDKHYSLQAQEADARALCQKEGWQIVDVLRVPGHSRDYKTLEKLAADARAQGIDAFDKLMQHFEARDFDVFICRDANRFGRSPSLIHQIVEYIIDDCGARIYSFNDGWVDSANADIFAMIKAYTTKKEMRWIRDMGQRGKDKLAERGLIPHVVPMTHIAVRDPRTGKQVAVAVNEAKRRLWDDIADLLLAGVGWNVLPRELEARGHVDGDTGKRYVFGKLYRLLYSPLTWGHTARRWGYGKTGKTSGGLWAIDDTVAPPPGVLVFRNSVPAVWTGETADKLKAELRRRTEMRGSRRPHNTHRFSGLVLCAECGRSMIVRAGKPGYYGLYCNTHLRRSFTDRDCANARIVSFTYLQAFFTEHLTRALDQHLPSILAEYSPTQPSQYAEQREAAEAERDVLIKQVERLIGEQAAAPDNLQPIYRDQLKAHADRLNALNNEVARLTARAAEAGDEAGAQARELAEIRDMTLEAFWMLPDREINQRLHAMLGGWRFLARDGEIVDATYTR